MNLNMCDFLNTENFLHYFTQQMGQDVFHRCLFTQIIFHLILYYFPLIPNTCKRYTQRTYYSLHSWHYLNSVDIL